jgi:hypothetical protein
VTSRIRSLATLVVAAVLTACAATPTATALPTAAPAGTGQTTAEHKGFDQPTRPGPRLAPAVREPLDARGVAPCGLLTPAQLIELGLDPRSARPGTAGAAETCGWTRPTDPGNPAGLQISTNPTIPSLDGIYIIRDTFDVFEPTQIAGHPAVHADGTAGSVCTIYTAIADYQAVSTDGNLAGRPLADPCGPSRRMAEMILSNLPPLR